MLFIPFIANSHFYLCIYSFAHLFIKIFMHSCIYLFIYLIAYYPFIYVFCYCFFELMHVQELMAAVLQNCAELHAHVTPLSGKSSTGGCALKSSKACSRSTTADRS